MADQTVSRLVIDVVTEADKATAGFDSVADGSKRMADQVDDASKRASRSLGVTADSTDNLASKSGQATGALGALSAGFELVGLEKYSGALQSASMATDFMSGVGDSLNLVLESQAVKTALARANTLRMAVTQRIVAAATRTWAAVQWVLNAALSANPIGLVVVAIALLVAGVILAYKKSETFRNIIQAVGRAGKAAIGWVVDKIGDLVGWVKDKAPAAFRTLKGAAESAMRLATAPIKTMLAVVKDVITWVRDKLGKAFTGIKSTIVGVGDAILKPFKSVLGVVKDIIDFIKKIKIPHIPGTSIGREAPSSARTVTSGAESTGSGGTYSGGRTVQYVTFQTTVQGAIDPAGTAGTIEQVLSKAARRQGLVVI